MKAQEVIDFVSAKSYYSIDELFWSMMDHGIDVDDLEEVVVCVDPQWDIHSVKAKSIYKVEDCLGDDMRSC